jgi:hypothetical protein
MGNGSLVIVADQDSRATLSALGKPVTQVQVSGRVVKNGEDSVLYVNSVAACQYKSLAITANGVVSGALSKAGEKDGAHNVCLVGRVLDTDGVKTLVLDQIGAAKSLPIIAEEDVQSSLADVAQSEGSDVNVKAKVQNGVLVLSKVEKA